MQVAVKADIAIIGGGIIGAACAYYLAQKNLKIIVIDHYKNPATNVGMGHLVRSDDDPDEFNLTHHSMSLWHDILPHMPSNCQWKQCGTLWLAMNDAELEISKTKQKLLADCNIASTILSKAGVQKLEPMVQGNITGGMQIPSDGIIYAPGVTHWFLNSSENIIQKFDTALHLEENIIELASGQKIEAENIIIATGLEYEQFTPFIDIVAKKGQLAITDRYPKIFDHELVELGYNTSVHTIEGSSIAFNIQHRPTGQIFIGSSREFNQTDKTINFPLFQQMLKRAHDFVPALKDLNIIRCWTGVRAATADRLPVIDKHPNYKNIYIAMGFEGMGIVAAPAAASLISNMIYNQASPYDLSKFKADRFLKENSSR